MAARRTQQQVVNLHDRRGVVDAGLIEITCANPRCDKRFVPGTRPGRRQRYHSEECRLAAVRDERRLKAQLEVLEAQVTQVRAQLLAYGVAEPDEQDAAQSSTAATEAEMATAREAVAMVKGMARFLPNSESEYAQDLLDLFTAVEPVVRRRE